eukprot:630594-Rhodomonas_salina.2
MERGRDRETRQSTVQSRVRDHPSAVVRMGESQYHSRYQSVVRVGEWRSKSRSRGRNRDAEPIDWSKEVRRRYADSVLGIA